MKNSPHNILLTIVLLMFSTFNNCTYSQIKKTTIKKETNTVSKSHDLIEENKNNPNRSELYKSLKIGNQVWMTENLNVSTFRNGDPIPEAKNKDDWFNQKDYQSGAKKPVWSYYDNEPINEKYGKLYSWDAVNDLRGLAPKGWHIPTEDEWKDLIDFLGGEAIAAKKIKNTTGWSDDGFGDSGNGTNESGLTGLPGGCYMGGKYFLLNIGGYWWSSTDFYKDQPTVAVKVRLITCSLDSVDQIAGMKSFGCGYSVRCIKD
jgi:uncharacterized protein (TIGR02145 family)